MYDNIFIPSLRKSMNDDLVISVFTNRNIPERCSVGIIVRLSLEAFVMKQISPDGLSDGFVIRRIEDLFRVDLDGLYEKKLATLYNVQNQSHDDFFKKGITFNNLLQEALSIAREKKLLVSVGIDETEEQAEITGFVKEVGYEKVVIDRVSPDGIPDGETIFYLEDVVKIDCETSTEKTIKILYGQR